MDAAIQLGAILAMLLAAGVLIGAADRPRFAPRWLLVATVLVALNDALLTRLYLRLPDLLPGSRWNWEGKLLALAATLAVAASPAFGWRPAGLARPRLAGNAAPVVAVTLGYALFVAVVGLAFPSGHPKAETVAFQLTMPGLEEEPFYRGVLLLALDKAFTGRRRVLGVECGWGALLTSLLFGLAHAFGYAHGRFSFDPLTMALTGGPALAVVWLRLRTGSVVLPITLHNLGNTALEFF